VNSVGSTASSQCRSTASSLPRWRDVAGCPAWRLSSATRSCAPSGPDGSSCRWRAGSSVSSLDPCPRNSSARPRLSRIYAAGSPSWRPPDRAAPCRSARDPCSRSLAIAPLLPATRKPDIAACWQSLPARRRNPGRNSNLGLGRLSHYATRVRHGRITVPRSRRKLIPKTAAKSDSARSTIGPSAVAVAASRPPAASPRSPSLARISATGCDLSRRFLANFLDCSLPPRHSSLDPLRVHVAPGFNPPDRVSYLLFASQLAEAAGRSRLQAFSFCRLARSKRSRQAPRER